ncbi:MAG: hypothetical protein KBF47_00290 [Gemmatimonadales bacterium]|nr:hypothetical protein [Gemmatimonadales bacterium]
MRVVQRGGLLLVVALAAVACAESPTSESSHEPSALIGPLCQLGCVEQDPDPAADGYWLGGGITDVVCFNGSQTDSDGDGLSEFCERNLASAFAPELYYKDYDEVGREPKWVARPLPDGTVRIGYLLAYYRDAGSSSFGCTLPGAPSSCYGHNGDSEAIALDVEYDEGTKHWKLQEARYSQHGDFVTYDAYSCTFVYNVGCLYLVYPDKDRGYPRAYVAEGKHANYATRSECNHGGFGNSDTCTSVNTAARVVAGSSATNLGSRGVHSAAQDCMVSSNPSYIYYGAWRTECFWTVKAFRGWIPDTVGGASSSDYSGILGDLGF